MKKITLVFMFIIASINYLFGQTETEHFIYEDVSSCFLLSVKIDFITAVYR